MATHYYTNNVLAGSGTMSLNGSTVTANPANGYRFVKFTITREDRFGSSYQQYSTTVTSSPYNMSNYANVNTSWVRADVYFELIPPPPVYYTVTVSTSGPHGSASGGGSKLQGSSYTITASTTSDRGRFVNWSNGSTKPSQSFTANGNASYTANFSSQEARVGVNDSNFGSATVELTGGTKYSDYRYVKQGDSITYRASNKTDGKFVRWTVNGNQVSTANPYTKTVGSSDETVVAVFAAKVTVSVSPNGAGTAKINGASSGYFVNGSQANLTASSSGGNAFLRWDRPAGTQLTTDPNPTVTIDTSKRSYVARFVSTDKLVTLLVDDPVWGDATIMVGQGDKGKEYSIPQGQSCTLVATPARFGVFGGWSVDDSIISTDNPATITWDNADPVEITAIFVEAAVFKFDLVSVMAAGGPAIAGCELRVAPGSEQQAYDLQPNERYGGPVVVEAVSTSGYHLAQLEMVMGGVTANTLAKTVTPTNNDLETWGLKSTWKWGASLELTVKGDTTITGTFAKDTYVIGFGLQDGTPVGNQVSAEWGETTMDITTPYNGIDGLEYGTYVKLTATPGGGDSFRGWYNSDGEFVSNEAVFTLQVTENVFYKARFGNVVNLSVNNSAPGSVVGKVLPSGSESDTIAFTYGDEVEIKAIPDEGKFFGGWHLDGKLQTSMLATHRFFPDGAVTYEAHFNDGKSPVLVHLTNGAQGGFGHLSFTVPNGIAETELTDAIAWHNRLKTLTGAVELPSPIEYGDPGISGADSYWELDGITEISLRSDPINPNAVFDRWEIAYINVENRDPRIPGYPQGDYYDFDNIQHLSSSLLTNVSIATHCIIRAKWRTDEPQQVTVGYFSGSNASMGATDLTPRGDEWKGPPTIQSKYRPGRKLTVLALPNNGYKFMGWYKGGQVLTTDSQYVFEVPSEPIELLARFAQDKDAVYVWEGSDHSKWFSWISKRFVAAKPLNMTSARVYADGYPVELTVHTASSPDSPREGGRRVMIQVERQDARRLPRLRPEKYIELEIQGQDTVQEAAISTSMEGLLQ